ncbi:hypothetical protein OAE35_02715, partial [Synechococcus sp. AH-551-E02]
QQGSPEQLDDQVVESLESPSLHEQASLSIPGFTNGTQAQDPRQQKQLRKDQSSQPAQGADSLGELRFADSDE